MEQDNDLADSSARILGRLNRNESCSTCSSSDEIQVFVNERRVGCLGGNDADASFQFQRQGCVDQIQLRSEDGAILGSLSAPECGFRGICIPLSKGTVELRIHNTAEGGSASALFTPAQRRWPGLLRAIVESARAMIFPQPSPAAVRGMRAVIVMQTLLTVVVLGMAADRIAAWITPERSGHSDTHAEAPPAVPQADVAKLEQQLGDLARMQAKTWEMVQSQRQDMAQLQLAVAKASSPQNHGGVVMPAARQKMGERQDVAAQDTGHRSPVSMGSAQMEQERLEAEIHNLTTVNARLSKEMAGLVEQNHDLEKKLKAAGSETAKVAVARQESGLAARRSERERHVSMTPHADARDNAHPFLFWVNFSEGATQESIDRWMHDMHGHRVAVNGGWQEVEVLQPSMPADRFLEKVRGAKLVKAVRVDR